MLLVFDTYGGLCNQFFDIDNAVNFCIHHKIKFTFRYCSFRDDNNLSNFFNKPFENLFNTKFLEKYDLYIPYNNLSLNEENTYNFLHSRRCVEGIINPNIDILTQLNEINKEYIVLKQFWSAVSANNVTVKIQNEKICEYILPNDAIMNEYNKIKSELIKGDYNFIHYRYEIDFIAHFHINNMESLNQIIDRVKNNFKNPNLPIYVATTNIKKLNIPLNTILSKNEENLKDYNFEQKAFIDYLFGLGSCEVYGHKQSSFSNMLNWLKLTNNFYN